MAAHCPGGYDFVVVVPAYAEASSFVDGYREAARRAGSVLLVVVLNGRIGAEEKIHAANEACFRGLAERYSLREFRKGAWLGQDARLTVLVVDRFTVGRRLPFRQGVGLARKIGADLGLELVATRRVRHPFLAFTDADAQLPGDYFERIASLDADCSAALFPFWHERTGLAAIDRATALYEIRLRYYRRGLAWAGSPYAFHTVGSTIAVHALWYALARGVPRRRAGEDFYLLNKLSKLRPLTCLKGDPIRLCSRLSERVPFGTGAESARLARGAAAELYHRECFLAVRQVTSALRRLAQEAVGTDAVGWSAAISHIFSDMDVTVQEFLEAQGAPDIWRRVCQNATDSGMRSHRLHEWFDAFRTLKLIHWVRDHGAPSTPWYEAVQRAPFMDEVIDDGACVRVPRTALLAAEEMMSVALGPGVASYASDENTQAD